MINGVMAHFADSHKVLSQGMEEEAAGMRSRLTSRFMEEILSLPLPLSFSLLLLLHNIKCRWCGGAIQTPTDGRREGPMDGHYAAK